jgi:hypothetical protein
MERGRGTPCPDLVHGKSVCIHAAWICTWRRTSRVHSNRDAALDVEIGHRRGTDLWNSDGIMPETFWFEKGNLPDSVSWELSVDDSRLRVVHAGTAAFPRDRPERFAKFFFGTSNA